MIWLQKTFKHTADKMFGHLWTSCSALLNAACLNELGAFVIGYRLVVGFPGWMIPAGFGAVAVLGLCVWAICHLRSGGHGARDAYPPLSLGQSRSKLVKVGQSVE